MVAEDCILSQKHRISGLVVEYIVAIDVTRARFPADAYAQAQSDISGDAPWGQDDCVQRAFLARGSRNVADGSIAQWLERLTADQQVPGSNPGWPFARFTQVGRLSGAAQF